MLNQLDFFININVDARKDLGEDSWCYCFGPNGGMIAAFDGCGGSGSRKHEFYTGRSEAYMASRMCAGAFFDAFRELLFDGTDNLQPEEAIARCAEYCQSVFTAYKPPKGQTSRIRSSMLSTLPTTTAAAILRQRNGLMEVTAFWAGDSRIYVLSPNGLAQVSTDDSDENDPYETDGMMTNSITADRAPKMNVKTVLVPYPAIVFAATDGCFAYYTTPMEFEGMLLSALMESQSAADWEARLKESIGQVAGDDYTLVMAVLGFGSFEALRQALWQRYSFLYENYLTHLQEIPPEDTATRQALWNSYRAEYTKYIEG